MAGKVGWLCAILLFTSHDEGIGTGWSCFIPNYNPRDIVANLKCLMKSEPVGPMHPWYRGFTGTIRLVEKDKYVAEGIIRKTNATTVEITELPIRSWTQTYKDYLETLLLGTEKTPPCIKVWSRVL